MLKEVISAVKGKISDILTGNGLVISRHPGAGRVGICRNYLKHWIPVCAGMTEWRASRLPAISARVSMG
jgi:hypothetical protein